MIKTNALRVLDRLAISYELREYDVDPNDLSAETVAARQKQPGNHRRLALDDHVAV
jgi:Cys-tRNA(Pro)/Cys-tRNA(Cys) deacylase